MWCLMFHMGTHLGRNNIKSSCGGIYICSVCTEVAFFCGGARSSTDPRDDGLNTLQEAVRDNLRCVSYASEGRGRK